jgi:hypothetical protein
MTLGMRKAENGFIINIYIPSGSGQEYIFTKLEDALLFIETQFRETY